MRADATAIAPERLLVFEVRGAIQSFINAIRNIPSLEFIDEEELDEDQNDKNPNMYLVVPDGTALTQIVSLWKRWQNDQLVRSETVWREVFETLRDIRPWGPNDRVGDAERDII